MKRIVLFILKCDIIFDSFNEVGARKEQETSTRSVVWKLGA